MCMRKVRVEFLGESCTVLFHNSFISFMMEGKLLNSDQVEEICEEEKFRLMSDMHGW